MQLKGAAASIHPVKSSCPSFSNIEVENVLCFQGKIVVTPASNLSFSEASLTQWTGGVCMCVNKELYHTAI